jgi:hypothetical protein
MLESKKMANIDPIQFGRMMEALDNLTQSNSRLETKVDTLQTEVQALVDLRNRGTGLLIGLMTASGGLGAFIADFWSKVK